MSHLSKARTLCTLRATIVPARESLGHESLKMGGILHIIPAWESLGRWGTRMTDLARIIPTWETVSAAEKRRRMNQRLMLATWTS